jgi:hypothetical protein
MKSGLRNKDAPKIKESRKPELAIATIQVARAASMSLQLRTEGRAALGTKDLNCNFSVQIKASMKRPVCDFCGPVRGSATKPSAKIRGVGGKPIP